MKTLKPAQPELDSEPAHGVRKNCYAVLMGFNKFKDKSRLPDLKFCEKDATDLYDVLTDPLYGNYPKENVTLVTGSEIRMHLAEGEEYPEKIRRLVNGDIPITEIETEDIETIIYTQAVNNRTPGDIVLVYYSGHGFFAGKHGKAYLATPDVSTLNINSNPKAGLQMEFLHNDIFLDTKAKNVIFLLDCCHSGAFCTGIERKDQNDLRQLVEARFYAGEGRVAFVSSPREIISRESKDYKNGIFTYHLINGLKGAGKEPNDDVTVAGLVSYVQRMCPPSQPPVFYGNTTRVVLTRPSVTPDDGKSVYKVYSGNLLPSNIDRSLEFVPLPNPLDPQIHYAETIVTSLKTIYAEPHASVGNQILSSIRASLNAEFAFLQRIEENAGEKDIIYQYESDLAVKGFDLEEYKSLVIKELYSIITRKKKELLPTRFGFSVPFEGRKSSDNYLLVIPLRLEYPREFLVLTGVSSDSLRFGELIGRVLMSVYEATRAFTTVNMLDVETKILDDIKQDFGHVPRAIYDKRFDLFTKKLSTIYFAFEPIILLARHEPEIHSWEALARDPETQSAPVNLFKAAELWGPHFITELDVYCLKNAVSDYVRIWEDEHPGRKKDQLSVNVYPDTIFRSVYKEEIRKIIDEGKIKFDRLVLEISEKRPLPPPEKIQESVFGRVDPAEEFMKKIFEFTNDLQISFAIDDFGVGHSSVSRLITMDLNHIKVDRDILLHPHPELTVKYVQSIIKKSHPHKNEIVIEGYDGESRISLKELYDLGIRHMQGHLLRRAATSLSDLSQQEREYIEGEINSSGPAEKVSCYGA